ncbi:hypothetical protein COT60_03790 [Candidatus Pacearchaeota archaeon CG09_land_8_20_14_0_10_30_9]|nr:hypothetical protein [Candidatus Pacearchaeota archaeon]OIO40054.1 MAG: hypothetical protein AUJ61_02945 [Candidatus Pacearchaeota archaeon CG1_02_30_18]PIN71204.1 MAG: hypothetical protein COV77_03185 [Candidatus Pacearchaeota archaeon CG11_big_fil_rev_8_21_14_0_20_30_13]PIO00807.1 MAG: hypothetical protein COT60_03790 [Candidatus Pacearchaeota archaeon CG09_land_8_20_14_0_10_30_9]PIZ82046.1 MAG: hypothetical protein COX98_01260 [Candidatus Pacearchaeota archaeon CG_4_10_14_0_2_um_filter_30
MGISFCKKCKNILPPTNSKENIFIECLSCGLNQKIEDKTISNEKIYKKIEKGAGIANEENVYATYENICGKCGHNKSQIIDLGIKYSDEDNLIFLKCGKCGFSERIGRKTS